MITHTINGLFNENFNPDDIELKISKTATEFPKNNLDMLRADMFVKFEKPAQKRHFHVEYQLSAESNLVMRVFEYGMQKAIAVRREESDNSGRLKLPRAVVIHFDESESIPDRYVLEVEFPNGTTNEYTADVLKYWKLDEKQLIEKKLYILLPLQVFLLRAKLESATKANDEQERQKTITDAVKITEKIRDIVTELYEENLFDINDYDKLMLGLAEVFRHINDRYAVNPRLNMEVDEMVKTLMDKNLLKKLENAEKQTKIEMAKKMILKNKPIDEIIEFTELTEKEIKNIEKQLIAD
jgi:hypothetical protein